MSARTRRITGRVALNAAAVVVFACSVFPVYWMVNTALLPGSAVKSDVPHFWPDQFTLKSFEAAWNGGFVPALGISLALAESMVTPKTVTDLLDDGWPQGVEGAKPDKAGRGGLRIDGLGRLLAYYLASEMRGFRTVVMIVPPDAARADQLRVRMRLRGSVWRLIDIEVTEALRARVAQKLAKALARVRGGDRAQPPDLGESLGGSR